MTIVAIDPGKSGGIAWQIDGGLPAAIKMPETEADICEEICAITSSTPLAYRPTQCLAIIEEVSSGVIPGRAVAMSKLNANAAFIRGVLCALNVRMILVRPRKWQGHFSLGGTRAGFGSDTEWKNKLKAEAQRRFPGLKVTLSTADALLLLDYGKEVHK